MKLLIFRPFSFCLNAQLPQIVLGYRSTDTDVQVAAFGTLPQRPRTAKHKYDAIVQDEILETAPDGSLSVVFADGTEFLLGSDTSVVIDEFIYDPNTRDGHALVQLAVGTLYYVSGHLPNESVVIYTPTATIGIRGTKFYATVGDNSATAVDVVSGAVELTSKADGLSTIIGIGTLGANRWRGMDRQRG